MVKGIETTNRTDKGPSRAAIRATL